MLTRKEVLRQVSGLDVWWTLRASINYGCRALTERLHSQSLNRLSADTEPTDIEPQSNVDGFKALIKHMTMQSLDYIYSRRHLESSQGLIKS